MTEKTSITAITGSPQGHFEAAESDLFGDQEPITADHRTLDVDWEYVRTLYAAGNVKAIRMHCAMRRADPEQVLRTLGPVLS